MYIYVAPASIVLRMRKFLQTKVIEKIKTHILCSIMFSWFQTCDVFWMLYAFFWVIPRCLNFICRHFGTLCLFQYIYVAPASIVLRMRNFADKSYRENQNTYFMFNNVFLISKLRRVLNVVCFLLGNSPVSEFYMPTFRNTLSVPSS